MPCFKVNFLFFLAFIWLGFLSRNYWSSLDHDLMASIWVKAISILAGNLNSGRSYLITAVCKQVFSWYEYFHCIDKFSNLPHIFMLTQIMKNISIWMFDSYILLSLNYHYHYSLENLEGKFFNYHFLFWALFKIWYTSTPLI